MNNTISSLEVQDGIEFENNNVSKRIQDLFQLIQEELEELSNFAQKLSLSRILRSKKDDSEEVNFLSSFRSLLSFAPFVRI